MKYLYPLLLITLLLALPWMEAGSRHESKEPPRLGARPAAPLVGQVVSPLPAYPAREGGGDAGGGEKPRGLQYSKAEHSWTLQARLLQVRQTSIYGRPGEIGQIEYALAGEELRRGWIVLRIEAYSFIEGDGEGENLRPGQELQLSVSGGQVSARGVDWEACPKEDPYCLHAAFIEGGFPASQDYDGLTLCPSNTLIRSGFLPDDWVNGMLAWRIRVPGTENRLPVGE